MSSDIHADRPVHEGEDLSANEFGDHQHGATDRQYIVIAVILALITAGEVTLSYIDVGPIFLPALLIMMAAKFIIVVSFFMHLKFDDRRYARFFVMGLAGAITLFLIVLLTFQVFSS